MMRENPALFVAVAAMLLAGSASAHHNMMASFDFKNPVKLTGTLTKVDWRNPHIEFMVDVRQETTGDQFDFFPHRARKEDHK